MRIGRASLVALLVVGVLPFASTNAAGAPSGFVQADGARLVVDGLPWRAVGVNLWDMDVRKAIANDLTGCYYQHPDLDAYFDASFRRIASETHATVVRTFGFRPQYTAGGRDWASTDKLLYYAQKHNLRVIPVFGDQYPSCGTPFKTPAWYHCTVAQPADCTPGYRQPDVWEVSYRDYVVAAVRRYKDNPTVAFWQLMNEAFSGSVGGALDTTALPDFSRDMVAAIRGEAGDQHHLVNLGTIGRETPGAQLPYYGRLLDCPATGPGGCTDLAEVHDYSGLPLHGTPLGSAVVAHLVMWNEYGERSQANPVPLAIDGWTVVKANVTLPASRQPHRYWGVILTAPKGSAWSMLLDDAVVQTLAGPQVYSFETGTEGFTSTEAAVSQTAKQARTGLASLQADVPAATGVVNVSAPPILGPAATIEVALRLNFDAPRPDSGATIAADLHAAVIARGKPFFSGEVGIPAAVPGANPQQQDLSRGRVGCVPHATLAQRAAAYDAMMSLQMDADHRSGGFVVWDWKDPGLPATRPDGTPAPDPTLSCYSVTPGDPAVDVLARWAATTPVPPLPQPAPLPAEVPVLVALKGPPATVGTGSTVPVQARLTRGGDAYRGIKVLASGGCEGSGTTDALGIANLSCTFGNELGARTITVEVDPESCRCSIPGTAYQVLVKRAVRLAARAEVVETGTPAPLLLTISSQDGGSVQGLAWEVPECGLSGVVGQDSASVSISADCPTNDPARSGLSVLRLKVAETPTGLGAELRFPGLALDRIYVDTKTGDCVGLSPESGWVGATEGWSDWCTAGRYGSALDWFVFRVPAGERSTAFTRAGSRLMVASGSSNGRRVAGQFEFYDTDSRDFSATVTRRDGTHLLSSL